MATKLPDNRATMTVADAVRATGGTLRIGDPARVVTGFFSDNRSVVPGAAFVALRGASHDGHAFAPGAAANGAALLVVAAGYEGTYGQAAVIEVADTLVAWGALAAAHLATWRRTGDKRVVAITGSAGKTTTKELTRALLAAVAPGYATPGNLNNRIGVPAVVFAIEEVHRYAVVEMGMSLPGEIARTAAIAPPDVAVVTNVGLAHAEGVGGREGVMREKGAVYRGLREGGIAIVNADDDYAQRAATGCGRIVTFGRSANARYRLVDRTPRGPEGADVRFACAGRELTVFLPLPGEAAALDLAAALAAQEAASGVALDPSAVDRALATVVLEGRAAVRRLGRDTLVIDDSYNANPGSMRAALSSLAEIGQARRRVVVLGEMKELGAHATPEHVALGDAVADAGVALAVGCGGLVDLTLARAKERGVEVVMAPDTASAAREVLARIQPGDVVLVKGSRSVGAEKVVAKLSETLPYAENFASLGAPR